MMDVLLYAGCYLVACVAKSWLDGRPIWRRDR